MSSGNIFNWFKSSSKTDSTKQASSQWDPQTLTMHQPTSPEAPTTERTVTEQPSSQESMTMHLRGGGAGEVCCGVCAGLMCFECCEDCC